MKKHRLITQLSAGFACIVLVTIALISAAANVWINRQFEDYVENQQKEFAAGLAGRLSNVYDAAENTWNTEYIHGTGMYALQDGYIMKVYDKDGRIVWDAQNHNMEACHQVMDGITVLMETRKPSLDGRFVTEKYDLRQQGSVIGALEVSYYSPYYLNENAFRFLDALNRILAVIGAAALAGAAAAAYFLARRFTVPLENIIHVTKEISEGNYGIRFETEPETKELHELMQSIRRLAKSLKQQEALRRQMTTDMAHELKTPLAIVSSHLEAMMEGVWEPTQPRLQSCRDEIGRITRLVTELQRISQTENDSRRLDKEPVKLKALAEEMTARFEGQFRQHRLLCTVEGEESIVEADKGKLQQVMTNLLSNAVKYTEPGKRIEMIIEDMPDYAVVTVADEGIGIPEKDQEKVFERFYRVDKSHSRKTGGAGIGLTIVKTIVQAHGGKVMLESEIGKGSRFHIQLPKR